jgi:hypothetical protein
LGADSRDFIASGLGADSRDFIAPGLGADSRDFIASGLGADSRDFIALGAGPLVLCADGSAEPVASAAPLPPLTSAMTTKAPSAPAATCHPRRASERLLSFTFLPAGVFGFMYALRLVVSEILGGTPLPAANVL